MTYRVILDYGHGGSKPGAVYEGAVEKQLNLLTGQQIYKALHEQGAGQAPLKVLLTRDDDYDVPLRTRYKLINRVNQEHPINLVMSVHYNAAGTPSASGFEVYYLDGSANGELAAKKVAKAVDDDHSNLRGKGYKTTAELGRNLAMIHKTQPPAVLIEVGFLTNPSDRKLAMLPEYRKAMADSVAKGIWGYLQGV